MSVEKYVVGAIRIEEGTLTGPAEELSKAIVQEWDALMLDMRELLWSEVMPWVSEERGRALDRLERQDPEP